MVRSDVARPFVSARPVFFSVLSAVSVFWSTVAAEPLDVVTTTPDLASLVREVGGDEVEVDSITKGPQDPHYIEAKPSFIKSLHEADLYIQVGLDLEAGWAPALLRAARNSDILPGAKGHFDASRSVRKLQVPSGRVDRSRGDVHPAGNPHYLLDPMNGLRVAAAIRDKLAELRPERRELFEERFASFRRRLAASLFGKELLAALDDEELAKLLLLLDRSDIGRVVDVVGEMGHQELLDGWAGALLPHRGSEVVADHDLWPYFEERFTVDVVEFLEPKPGIAPTTKHLARVIEKMKSGRIRAILSSPYFGSRSARFVADRTGAKVVPMAHQVGAREGVDDYIGLIDHDVRSLAEALEERP